MMVAAVGLTGLVGGGALSAVTSTPAHAATPVLNGPTWPFNISPTVVVHNLYMDSNWDADNPANLSKEVIDDFTNQLLVTGYFSKAAQYGVTQVSFNGSDQAIPACPPPPPSFNFFQLSSWILCEKHNLPASSVNGVNLWQVYAPINSGIHMQISWPWGNSTQIINTCQPAGSPMDGFHSQTLPSVFPFDGPQTFGIVFPSCAMSLGFGSTGTMLETTKAGSHELIEAVTDPQGMSWYDRALGSNGEAGDLCENGNPSNGFIASGSYQIASYWSNADMGCVAPGNGSVRVVPPTQARVPAVVGQSSQQAAATIRSAGFGVSIASVFDRLCNYTRNQVMSQSPLGGSMANVGSNVTIRVAVEPTSCP